MRLLLSAALAVLIATGIVRAGATSLVIATGEYEPYTGRNLPNDGAVNDVVRQVAERSGYAVEFSYMPWKRNLEATRQGKYSASSYWSYSQERQEDFIHVGPIIDTREMFFVRADSGLTEWETLADLSHLRIGVVPGYTYTQELWDMIEDGSLTASEAVSDEANMKKLLAGRIDVFPMEEVSGWYLIDQKFSEEEAAQITVMTRPLSVTGGYLLVSRSIPDSEELAATLQATVDEMRGGQ